MVHWNETFIIGENPTKCWFSVNTSDKFTVFTTNCNIWKGKWANIFLFNGEVYVLMFRGHIFAKRVGRFRWFEKYKNIINIPSIKTWFELNRTFIEPVLLMMWNENVREKCKENVRNAVLIKRILSKTERESIYYHFRRNHESSNFQKLARYKWICREICDFFSWST